MEMKEELAHVRKIADRQSKDIDALREVILAVSSPISTSDESQCWCGKKEHTKECLFGTALMRVYQRGKNGSGLTQ